MTGNNSFLHAVRNNPNECVIDWDSMNPVNLLHHRIKDLREGPVENRPKTLGEMAEVWNKTNFIGYLNKDYIESLKEFCKALIPYGCNPRLYYQYEGMYQITCVEFIPGTGIINISCFDFHRSIESIPYYPNLSKELTQELNDLRESYQSFLIKYCIDHHPWTFQRLE
jgi:hypothetical protein